MLQLTLHSSADKPNTWNIPELKAKLIAVPLARVATERRD
jgi:hypothetical protein